MKLAPVLGTLLAISLASSAVAHSGRTNASGCHTNRRTGDYHCHNGGTPSGSSGSGSNTPQPQPAPQDDLSRLANEQWTILSIGDGDTVRVSSSQGETITVRLACIDAPEMAQAPYGENARRQLQALTPVGSAVTLLPVDRDRYNRVVAEVLTQNFNVNLTMVDAGAAVAYRQYLGNCNAERYLEIENGARQNRLGFWNQANPVMPWDFRRNN